MKISFNNFFNNIKFYKFKDIILYWKFYANLILYKILHL